MNSKFDLTGKVAVVTGASTEIGMDAAKAYAEAGADVVLIAENVENLSELKAEIEKLGSRVITIGCDVTNGDSVKSAVNTIENKFGKIDILLNNSSMALQEELESMTDADWNRTFGEVFRGVYFASRFIIPGMQARGSGRIINISSANSRTPDRNGIWGASPRDKVADLTTFLAKLYSQFGIAINTIGPERIAEGENSLINTILGLSDGSENLVYGQFVAANSVKAIA